MDTIICVILYYNLRKIRSTLHNIYIYYIIYSLNYEISNKNLPIYVGTYPMRQFINYMKTKRRADIDVVIEIRRINVGVKGIVLYFD